VSIETKNYQPTPLEREIPLSLTLEFVPNPRFVSPEVVAELSQDELQAAQLAYNMLQAPYNAAVNPQEEAYKTDYNYFEVYKQKNHEESLKTFVTGFKTLRCLAGEEEYAGLEVEPISSTERTDLEDYISLAGEGKIAHSAWGKHDAFYHLMGTLLSTAEIRDLVMAGAKAALELNLDRDKLENVGAYIDDVTNRIRLVWENAGTNNSVEELANTLDMLRSMTGLTDYNYDKILGIAQAQAEAIEELRRKTIFMHPKNLELMKQAGIIATAA
jgi:hypothetical protein